MAETFPFRLVTPTGIVFEGQVVEVSAWGPLGEFGVLAEHINFITSLVPGVMEAKLPDGSTRRWVVSGGLVEVKDGAMTALASGAEAPEILDPSAAAAELREAEEKFSNVSFYEPEYVIANEALMLARARVEATAANRPALH
jgi:F-type H+-transporting ATPase subunit epsilon